MDPITGGIISGGAGLIGTFLSNQQSAHEAQDQMDFQRSMSDSAHQREVRDLKAAGLNPILSALGSGASTPSGAQGSVNDFAPSISKGFDTAVAIRGQNSAIENQKADTINKRATESLIENQSAATAKDIESKSLQNSLLKQTLPSMIKKAKAEGDYSEINQLMGIISSGVNSAGSAVNLFNPLKTMLLKGK